MLTGLNMHCAKHPRMTVRCGGEHSWILLSSGDPGPHSPSSEMAIHLQNASVADLQRAADAFNSAFAPVVAIVDDDGEMRRLPVAAE